jgi:uncharacterized protein
MKTSWFQGHWQGIVTAILYALPVLTLLPLGLLWLLDHHALLPWAGALLFCSASASGLIWLNRRERNAELPITPAETDWGASEQAAWAKVEAFANSAPLLSFATYQDTTKTLHQTIDLVANSLHSDRENAIAHFTVPEALTAAEALCRLIKRQLVLTVPFIKQVHLSDGLWLNERYDRNKYWLKWVMSAIRAPRAFMNPEAAALREKATLVVNKTVNALTSATQRQITRTVIQETGRVAINLYSGRFRLTDGDVERFITMERDRLAAPTPPHPIKILITGQVNAGKSSLINALANSMRAPVHALPTSAMVCRYEIKSDGYPAVDLVETPGLTNSESSLNTMLVEAARADLILWVLAAGQPARDVDVKAIAALRQQLNTTIGHPPPPILLAVTQIDRLRPAMEWLPPYNIAVPDRPKAITIRDAVAAAAGAISVPPDAAVPIAMPNGVDPYQIDVLWARIGSLLPEAQQTQLNRVIGGIRADWNVSEIMAQCLRLGTILVGPAIPESAAFGSIMSRTCSDQRSKRILVMLPPMS